MAEKYVIGQKVSEKLTEIEVNEYHDVIYIDINDTTFVNKVIDLFQWFGTMQTKIDILKKDYDKETKEFNIPDEITEENILDAKFNSFLDVYKQYNEKLVSIQKEICERFDMIFGNGTIRKYFRKIYETFGDEWVPDTDCIEDFIDEIIPVIEKLFNDRKASIRRRYTKKKKK